MKELTITLADVLYFIYSEHEIIQEALHYAKRIGLGTPIDFLVKTSANLLRSLINDGTPPPFPLRVPLFIVVKAWTENFKVRCGYERLRPLKELLKIPSSKGIATLLRYVGL